MLVAVTPGAVLPPFPPLLLPPLLAPPPLALLVELLLEDPHAATISATATMTPTYASHLVPRKLIPLLLHTVDPTALVRMSTRGM
jgi:hypothetical protein